MTRIWLNHWFSTAYNIINLIREDDKEFQIIGSNENKESPIKMACDEWYQEPVLKDDEYVDFCLDFCKEHAIDIFMPRREMVAISKNKDKFTQLGIKVMVDDYKYVKILNNKELAYDAFRAEGVGRVPDYYMVTTVEQFKEAYNKLLEKYKMVCFKFVRDEGGKSFRLIDNTSKGYTSLFKKQSTTRISLEDAISLLSEREIFAPMMVMPYLPDVEISVDCLMTSDGLIAIPRVKDYTRIEKIRYDEEILSTCNKFFEKFPLEQPCNVQLKYLDGIPYMLEVNTRMSGGVQMACAASGVNIPNIAVNKLLGINKSWENNMLERCVTHVETPRFVKYSYRRYFLDLLFFRPG